MEHKEIYSRILDIHKHIFEQLKFAETKNNILLVFIAAFIAMTVRFLQSSNNDNIGIKVFMISMLIILLCAAFELLLSFKPILDNKEKEYNFLVRIFKYFVKTQSSPNLCNIYFFKDLAKINSKELIEIIIRDLEDNTEKEKIQNDKFINDLLNQICVLSLITLNKHKCFLNSLFYVVLLFICFFIIIIIEIFSIIKIF
ncbi:hypothetical protein CV473_02670 [Campylobacter jejuni subsp. jejuni]|uniref:hypothetical protein n=1 Tax=Campylobacter jejuni TaxID=197 RepID=UPI000C291559|nr:hypothetical protein [Campylobacter jejuni]EKT7749535.1 hypothetical protein [Campylobacter jejuni]ELM7700100.1 hypothetical protein [Campylobacter jejuni]PJQ48448.1 hypothetical protein CV473_02670 [Campylobacter jejuni subsp. jejuni]HEF1041788.1 hypothetical protein [Campylobacter jejuni]HEF1058051.1 hypothetical protein [Campylobacter jejuni]